MEKDNFFAFSSLEKSLETNAQCLQSDCSFSSDNMLLDKDKFLNDYENSKLPYDSFSTWSNELKLHKIAYQKQIPDFIASRCREILLVSSVKFKKNKIDAYFPYEFNHSNYCNISHKKHSSEKLLLDYKDCSSKIVKLKVAPRSFLRKPLHSFFIRENQKNNFCKKEEVKLCDQDVIHERRCSMGSNGALSYYVSISTSAEAESSSIFSLLQFACNSAPWPTIENVHVRDFSLNEILVKDIFSFRKKSTEKKEFIEDYYLKEYFSLLNQEKSISEMNFSRFNQLVYSVEDLKSLVTSIIPYSDLKRPCFDKIYKELGNKFFYSNFFDTRLWTSKYSPIRAHEVIFSEDEVMRLYDWLMSRKLGSNITEVSCVVASSKRRILEKEYDKICLDKFRNYHDDDDDNGNDNSLFSDDTGELTVLLKHQKLYNKSNMLSLRYMLLIGPHGSYKSASVYAVAKELGFEIFEINSATRRSGKDILGAVGEMTQSHLVNGKGIINSGKTCFKTRLDTPFQKQSLILIEEVDILYEEDRNFWSTIMDLIHRSKRPVIMTCTDINTIPDVFLEFQSMIYFKTAPVKLAADYLYLLSLSEGYIFNKNDLLLLYVNKGYDLRASILQLQFSTQIRNNFEGSRLLNSTNIFTSNTSGFKKVVFENTLWPSIEWPNDFCQLLEVAITIEGRGYSDLIDDIFKNSVKDVKIKDYVEVHGEIEKKGLFLRIHSDFLDIVSFCDYLSSELFEYSELEHFDFNYLSQDSCGIHSDNLLGYNFLPSYRTYLSFYQMNYIYTLLTIFIMSCSIFSNRLDNTDLDTLNIYQYVSNVRSLNIMSRRCYETGIKELTIDSLKGVFRFLLSSELSTDDMNFYSISTLNGFSLSVDIAPYIRDIVRFYRLYKQNHEEYTIINSSRKITRGSLDVLRNCNLRKLNKYKMKDEKAILNTWIE
ncbi:hypothetical protein PCANB_002950 [Pneumocystis canis]|nr:hypothetical protein PCANB_002950 [Pneumocystis canis]